MVIQSGWHWHKEGLLGQWDRTASPEINRHVCGQVIATGTKSSQWGKEEPFQQTVLGPLGVHTEKDEPHTIHKDVPHTIH